MNRTNRNISSKKQNNKKLSIITEKLSICLWLLLKHNNKIIPIIFYVIACVCRTEIEFLKIKNFFLHTNAIIIYMIFPGFIFKTNLINFLVVVVVELKIIS